MTVRCREVTFSIPVMKKPGGKEPQGLVSGQNGGFYSDTASFLWWSAGISTVRIWWTSELSPGSMWAVFVSKEPFVCSQSGDTATNTRMINSSPLSLSACLLLSLCVCVLVCLSACLPVCMSLLSLCSTEATYRQSSFVLNVCTVEK